MTAEELLAPVDEAAPAGPDLSYSPERYAIEEAFERAAQGENDVDWRDTLRQIEAQLSRTKDVWLAVALARAGARAGRLESVETGCATLAGLFDRYWTTAHPSVEDYGLQGRKGPCESLTRIGEFLGPLRRTTLVTHPRLGTYSGEDFERFAREQEVADGYGLFRAALAETPTAMLRDAIDQLDGIRAAVAAADLILTSRATELGETGTNFQTTYAAIDAIRAAVAPYAVIPDPDGTVEAMTDGADGAADLPVPMRHSQVDSREEVVRALDAIADYYRRREPSSPIPVALQRVRGWVTMDFMAILRDIAPNSVSDVSSVLLARAEEKSANW